MKNEEISLNTKKMLAQSLKRAMEKKTLSKVTVNELIKDCNLNRNTFYYHFSDIYDLLKWMLEQEAVEVVKKIDLLVDTEEAIRFVLNYVNESRHIINCAYDSMGHQEMKRFFYTDFIGVMKQAINSGARQMQLSISEEFKDFMAQFYAEALASMTISHIKNTQKSEDDVLIQNMLFILKTSMPHLLKERAAYERK